MDSERLVNPGHYTIPSLEDYPFSVSLPTRWTDVGAAGDIDHIAMARYYEDARIAMMRAALGAERMGAWRAFLVRFNPEQYGAVHYPEPLVMAIGLRSLGRSTYIFSQGAFQNGACVGYCEAINAVVGSDNRPCLIADEHRPALEPFLMPPQEPAREHLKPDVAQLRPERFGHHLELETRFSDTDKVGHINNVAALRYYQNGLGRFLLDCSMPVTMLARCRIATADVSYLGEAHHPLPIQVGTAFVDTDGPFLMLRQALFQQHHCVGLRDLNLGIRGEDGRWASFSKPALDSLRNYGIKGE